MPGADIPSASSPGGPPPGDAAPGPAGELDAAILIQDDAWTADLPAAGELARKATLAAWAALPASARPDAADGAEVSVVLADDAAVKELNRAYRGQDKPTNVLSFANLDDTAAAGGAPVPLGSGPLGPVLLGDVVLARETVLAEARAQAKTAADHLCHLCVHGLLHLLGYDHMADAEAAAMEALERRVLAGLGIADPYAEPPPDAQAPGTQAVAESAGGR